MDTLLRLKNVSFSYDQPILKSVNFELPASKIVAVSGPAGCGKSIFLKIAIGLIAPDEGELILFGKNFWGLGRLDMMKFKAQTAFFFQDGALLANMTVFDNLALPLRYHHAMVRNDIESRINPLLERLGLLNYRNQFPASLTLRLRQRVALARMLLAESPKIYFLDGPEVLEDEIKEIVAKTIIDAKAKGIPSLITGNSSWTKGLSDGGANVF